MGNLSKAACLALFAVLTATVNHVLADTEIVNGIEWTYHIENGAAIVGTTFAMPAEAVTLAATFAEEEELNQMFYIGGTGYDSWMDVYAAAKAGDTIVVGVNAEIRQSSGTFSKSVTIDLHGHELNFIQGWLTGCSVDVVDTGAPAGQFVVSAYSMNVGGGTLDLSSLVSGQVTGRFQMSGTTLLAFPGDRPFADCTSAITTKAEGARIVVQGVTYVYDGTGWGVAFKITSIDVYDDVVEFGVMTSGDGPVTILGSETVNGKYNALTTTKISDGLYQVPVSACRFFKAEMEMQ